MQGDEDERVFAQNKEGINKYFTWNGNNAYYSPDFTGVPNPFLTDKDEKPF